MVKKEHFTKSQCKHLAGKLMDSANIFLGGMVLNNIWVQEEWSHVIVGLSVYGILLLITYFLAKDV